MEKMMATGMHKVIVSSGEVHDQVMKEWPDGADGIVDTIVSKTSLADDFKIRNKKAYLCLAGSLTDSYDSSNSGSFVKALLRPRVGFYDSGTISVKKDGGKIQEIVKRVEQGIYNPHIDKVYPFDKLQEAHERMDQNGFTGKAVIEVK